MGKKIYDWAVIAVDYNAGLPCSGISAKYGCSYEGIQKAIATGKLTRRHRIKGTQRPRREKTKEENSAYCKAHYRKNAARYKQKSKTNSAIRAEKCRGIILQRFAAGCVDCGNTDPLVLEFDHRARQDKSYGISNISSARSANIKRLISELKKCDVRCANCHRRKTALEVGSWRTKLVLTTGIEPVFPGPQPSGLPLT